MLVHSSWKLNSSIYDHLLYGVRLLDCMSVRLSVRQSVSLPPCLSVCLLCLSVYLFCNFFHIFDILSRTTKPRPGQVLQFILYIFSALPSFKSVCKIWYKIAALTAKLFPSCYEKRHSVDQTTNNETEYHELSLFILYA